MGALSPTHWLIIVGVLVLLFGAKRLPDAARSLGRSARILKAEVGEARTDGDTVAPAPPPAPSSAPAPEAAGTPSVIAAPTPVTAPPVTTPAAPSA